MAPVSACPNSATLGRLLLGELPADEAQGWEAHLAGCDDCVANVASLRASDTLLETMQQLTAPAAAAPDDAVEELIQRLCTRTFTQLDMPASVGTEESLDVLALPQHADEIGRFGPYPVHRVLGVGGMGIVFEAEEPQLGRRVALKVMRPLLAVNPSARRRFLREARALAQLQHDHIAGIYQVGEQNGLPFLTMPVLQGESLQERLRRDHRLPIAEVVRIGREAADGLAAAHAHGIVHRDINPANLWLETTPTGYRVKVMDFGLAREVDEAPLTQAGVVMGTPPYLAPEQARGEAVDVRADLFSLGCVLYRASTGQPPFRGADLTALLTSLALDRPTPPRRLNPDVPPELSELILSLLAQDRQQRPASAEAVSAVLSAIRPGPRRSRRAVRIVVALLLLTGIGLLLGRLVPPIPREQPTPERTETALDPRRIPVEERFSWQPKELVAVLGEHRGWHAGPVRTVALSRSGKHIASGGADGVVNIWDFSTLRLRVALRGHQGGVHAVAFDESGRRLFSAGADGTIRLWDWAAAPPREVAVLRGHKGAVHALALAGRRLVSAGADATVRLWRLNGDEVQEERILSGHREAVIALAVAPDGKLLATGEEATVRLWRLSTDGVTEQAGLPEKPRRLVSLAFSADGKTLACGGSDGLALWDVSAEPRRRGAQSTRRGVLNALAFRPDGKTLISANFGGGQVWELTGAEPREQVYFKPRADQAALLALALSADGNTLVSGGEEGTVRLWDVDGPQERLPGRGHRGAVEALAFSPDGKTLASVGVDRSVRLWDLVAAQPREKALLLGHTDVVRGVVFSSDGKALFTAGLDGTLRTWDTAKEKSVVRGLGLLDGLALSPGGRELAGGSRYQKVRLWDVSGAEPRETTQLPGESAAHWGLAYAPDGRTLAAALGSYALPARLWDLSGPQPQARVGPHGATVLAFSPDGKLLATAHEPKAQTDGHVRLWVRDGAQLREGELLLGNAGPITALTFAPDSKTLAVATQPGRLVVRRVAGGEILWSGTVPDEVRQLAFSPDGLSLASCHSNGTIYIVRLGNRN